MNITKQNSEVLEKFVFDRNLKNSTKREYKACIDKFTSLFNMGMKDLLAEAEAEEEEGIRWKKRKLKNRLIEYRSFLAKDYYSSTVLGEISRIQTIYRHFGIEIHDLPKLSIKNLKTSKPVVFMDLPDKKIIKDALKIANPIMKAIILFQVSSGCARNETLSLSIADFMEATSEYHIDKSIEINKIAKIFALRVAAKYKDINEILQDSKFEFSLKVCETWKGLINIKAGITLDDEEIERISAYLEVMTDGFSTIQPIMEECIS